MIALTLIVAQRDEAAHVTLTPGIDAKSVGTQAWHLAFLITLANWLYGVIAIGQRRFWEWGLLIRCELRRRMQ